MAGGVMRNKTLLLPSLKLFVKASIIGCQVYDTGPRDATGSPLVCLPPIGKHTTFMPFTHFNVSKKLFLAGTADVFYRQCLALSVRGYRYLQHAIDEQHMVLHPRVLSVESPPYWSQAEWCRGFKELLDHLCLEKVRVFQP